MVRDYLQRSTLAKAGFFGEIPRTILHEGNGLEYEGELNEETKLEEISGTATILPEELKKDGKTALKKALDGAAEEIAKKQAGMVLKELNESTAKSGNVVDGGGKPLSFELVMKAMKKIVIDFDGEGNPRLSTLLVHPSQRPRIEKMIEDMRTDQDKQKQWEDLLREKREEWRGREADRKLVG